jgi:hypothetical protein
LRYLLMETYLIVYPPHNLLESRRSYFTKPYFCDVPRNIQFPLKSDHDIAGPHRIIYNYDRLLDNWTKKYTFYLVGKLLHFFCEVVFVIHVNLPAGAFFSRFWGSLPSTFKIFHPWKKSSTIKSWPTFCDQYFWKFPIGTPALTKNAERYEW